MRAPIAPRDFRFTLSQVPRDWHPGGLAVSAWWDQLSLFFPVGERFFVRSVRHYLPQLEAMPNAGALRAEVQAFCEQEGYHAREHLAYNERLRAEGLPVGAFEALVVFFLGLAQKILSPRRQLAITCALEHYTSLMGEFVLARPELLEGADPTMAKLWRWHAAEENEHRSVAFDVYRAVGGTWFERSRIMVLTSVFFWGLMGPQIFVFFAKRGALFSPRTWWQLFRYLWLDPAALGILVKPLLQYFARDFHPAQRGGEALLDAWKASLPAQP